MIKFGRNHLFFGEKTKRVFKGIGVRTKLPSQNVVSDIKNDVSGGDKAPFNDLAEA